jgi:hypothetical protein
MSIRLNRVLEREKSAYNSAKYDLKGLRKETKSGDLSPDQVIDELKNLRGTLAEAINLLATREWGDAEARTDLVVDGQTLIEDVPVRFLVVLEKHVKRMREVMWKTTDRDTPDEIEAVGDRIEELFLAVRHARQEANLQHVEDKEVADPILDYIFEGPAVDGDDTTDDDTDDDAPDASLER